MARILLVEPDYKNKYPPLGLMKISTFHKNRGDTVKFVKGISKDAMSNIWDRIYITTLFTFHFDVTVKTIRRYKKCVQHADNIYVGGILASLMKAKLSEETAIKNIIEGQLDKASKIGYEEDINIDILSPDYDILDDIEYEYPAGDNYFAYTTRGCPNRCKFCAVPTLEPEFKTTNNIIKQIEDINNKYGVKRNLLLLDNNTLYSPDLHKIVEDIKSLGFVKYANFNEPMPLLTYIRRIENRINEKHNLSRAIVFLEKFSNRIRNSVQKNSFNEVLYEINNASDSKQKLLESIVLLQPFLDKYKSKALKRRYVDFNQGIDARLLTEDRIKILSEIPINPIRIAFDNIKQQKEYIKAVKLAHKYGFPEISNYILYNHDDKPEELWQRLQINSELKKELGCNIFSFPMKYIPIYNTNRDHIGKHWNKKYIRAIQSISLVTKGIVSTTKNFFEKAFGNTLKEYKEILMMPESFIIYRKYFEEEKKLTGEWLGLYRSLNSTEQSLLMESVKNNKPEFIENEYYSMNLKRILEFYEIKSNDVKN